MLNIYILFAWLSFIYDNNNWIFLIRKLKISQKLVDKEANYAFEVDTRQLISAENVLEDGVKGGNCRLVTRSQYAVW